MRTVSSSEHKQFEIPHLNKRCCEITQKITSEKFRFSIKEIRQFKMVENEDEAWQADPLVLQPVKQQDKVILKNLPNGLSLDGIRSMCEIYGTVINVRQPLGQSFAFVQYEHPE